MQVITATFQFVRFLPNYAEVKHVEVIFGGESPEIYERWSSICCNTYSRYSDLIEVEILSYHK